MKKSLIPVLVVLGVIVLSVVLVLLAQGGSYDLTVADPALGAAEAPLVLEEFADFQCPACATVQPILQQLLLEYPTQLKIVYRDFPLTQIHPQARSAAQGALCAAQQGKFPGYYKGLYETQAQWAGTGGDVMTFMNGLNGQLDIDTVAWQACFESRTVKKEVQRDYDEGISRQVSATPTFILNGETIENPGSVFAWIQLLNKRLEEKGLQPENGLENPVTDGGDQANS